jgi:hypothetical protein
MKTKTQNIIHFDSPRYETINAAHIEETKINAIAG